MNNSRLSRWTRKEVLNFRWSSFETPEKLVLSSTLRNKITQRVEVFLKGEAEFHRCKLPWRYGVLFFGPAGSGKTAASLAIATLLSWEAFTIPAHEILDSHLFERALKSATENSQRVIILEDVDQMIRTMEPNVFFTLLDHAIERTEGVFWIATTRHPEQIPKTQLIRPGRFDEFIRLESPDLSLRQELWTQLALYINRNESIPTEHLNEWVKLTEGFTFSHFEELRQVIARMNIEGRSYEEIEFAIKVYIEDQLIAGDRWGGRSDQMNELSERVQQVDTRVLMAALDMTDVFRRLIEKVIGDAAENAKTEKIE